MLLDFVKSIPSPIITFVVVVVLALLWNAYMEFLQKRDMSKAKIGIFFSRELLCLSHNIKSVQMDLVKINGDENSEERFSEALKFLKVNQQTEIKI